MPFTTQKRVKDVFYFFILCMGLLETESLGFDLGHLASKLGFFMQLKFACAAANVKVDKEKQRKKTRKKN
jgi:hypothetical protein